MLRSSSTLLGTITALVCSFPGFADIAESYNTLRDPQPFRCAARHIEPQGIGYNQGYTTLEVFLMTRQPLPRRWLPFLDARAHLFNNLQWAANAGFGLRYQRTRIWGGNLYYDYRQNNHYSYHQVGVGLESLGPRWDFRVNGYFPVAQTSHTRFRFAQFQQNYALISRRQESTMTGFDAEVGTHVQIASTPWYFAEGVYYLSGRDSSTWGGQMRLSVDLFNYLRIEGNASYDPLFKWIGQGQLSVIVPWGPRRQMKKQGRKGHGQVLAARAVQNVGRHEIIPIDVQHTRLKAINPLTGDPYLFWFVDNTSHSQGTFESPFNTLLDAQNISLPDDVLYLFAGDGTTTNMDQGIFLKDNQKLWGSGIAHRLDTPWGAFSIPAQTSSMPKISNTSGSGVTLATGNEISGILVSQASDHGIFGSNSGKTTIHDTVVFNVGLDGISLLQNTGNASISLKQVNLVNNLNNGVALQVENNAFVDLTIADSAFTGNSLAGSAFTLTDNAVVVSHLSNNLFQLNQQNGLSINDNTVTSAPSYYTFQENIFASNGLSALIANFSNPSSPIEVIFSGNTLRNNETSTTISFTGPQNILSAAHNSISYTSGGSGLSIQLSGPELQCTLTHNEFSYNQGQGVQVDTLNVANLEITANHNSMVRNGSNGLSISGLFDTISLSAAHNTLAFNNGNGFKCAFDSNISFHSLSHNQIHNNQGEGIYLSGTINQLNSNIQNNQIQNNAFSGIVFFGQYNNSFKSIISDNEITGTNGNGIYYIAAFNTPLYATLNNNTITSNTAPGLELSNGSFNDVYFSMQNNQFSRNGAEGIAISTQSTDPLYFTCSNNIVHGNGSSGIRITDTVVGSFSLVNCSIQGNSNGLEMNNNVSLSHLDITGCQIQYHNNDSLNIAATLAPHPLTFTSHINIAFNDLSFNQGNGLNAVFVLNDPCPDQIPLNIHHNTAHHNFLEGITIVIQDNGSDPRTLASSINSNQLLDNSGDGLAIDLSSSNSALTLLAKLQNNIARYNGGYGIHLVNEQFSQSSITATQNQLFNNLSDPLSGSFVIENIDDTSSICLDLQWNTSDTGYLLQNDSFLAPFTLIVPQTNTGSINTLGPISSSPTCP